MTNNERKKLFDGYKNSEDDFHRYKQSMQEAFTNGDFEESAKHLDFMKARLAQMACLKQILKEFKETEV